MWEGQCEPFRVAFCWIICCCKQCIFVRYVDPQCIYHARYAIGREYLCHTPYGKGPEKHTCHNPHLHKILTELIASVNKYTMIHQRMGMDETKQSEQKKKLMFSTVWRFTPEYFRPLYPEHTHAAKILPHQQITWHLEQQTRKQWLSRLSRVLTIPNCTPLCGASTGSYDGNNHKK